MGEKRCLFQPMTALQQRFSHQPQLRGVGGLEGQFEITHTAVQELGAARTGAATKVMALQQGHLQAPTDGFVGHRGSTGAAADHQKVEVVVSHASAGSLRWRRSIASARSGAALC